MTDPKDLAGPLLVWRQVKTGQRQYELMEGERRVAALAFYRAFGTSAEGDIDGERYTFKRTGFLHPQVTIRRYGSEQDIGMVRLTMGGNGALEFTDGKRYGFHKLSFWTNRWGFSDEQGKLIMSMHIRSSLLKREGEVTLDGGLTDRYANILMVLGWYMIIQLTEEGEMAAASAAT